MAVWFILSIVYLALALGGWIAGRTFRTSASWNVRFARLHRIASVVFLTGAPLHLVGSEFWYGKHIQPRGMATVSDFYRRFGEPRRIRVIENERGTTYHLHAHFPPFYVFALPSEPAVYVFDSSGHFVEWCRDPGDIPTYWELWPRAGGQDIDGNVFRKRFAGNAPFFPTRDE